MEKAATLKNGHVREGHVGNGYLNRNPAVLCIVLDLVLVSRTQKIVLVLRDKVFVVSIIGLERQSLGLDKKVLGQHCLSF